MGLHNFYKVSEMKEKKTFLPIFIDSRIISREDYENTAVFLYSSIYFHSRAEY